MSAASWRTFLQARVISLTFLRHFFHSNRFTKNTTCTPVAYSIEVLDVPEVLVGVEDDYGGDGIEGSGG
jgi:hypothetical protein